MSIFSTKYKTTVGTQVKRVVSDELMPNSAKLGLTRALFEGGDISTYVLEEMTQSLAIRADRMYEYAKNNYALGLPSSYAKASKPQNSAVQAVLEAMEGQDVVINYCRVGTPNLLHQGWVLLQQQYGYNALTNTLNPPDAVDGRTYWLEDMYVVFGEAMNGYLNSHSMERWGTSPSAGYTPQKPAQGPGTPFRKHTPPLYVPLLPDEVVEVKSLYQVDISYQDEDGRWRIRKEGRIQTDRLSLPAVVDDGTYYHVKYQVGDQTKYWMYNVADQLHPTIDNIAEFPVQVGEFFPFTYFRFMKTPMSNISTSPEYRTTKEMLRHLKMNYDEMEKGINENPEAADIEQAMMMFAVPAFTQDQLLLRYLCEFFDDMYARQDDPVQNEYIRVIRDSMTNEGYPTKDILYIMDRWFRMAIAHGGIFKSRKRGNIGEIGFYRLVHETITITDKYMVDTESGIPMERTRDRYVSRHRYQKQVAVGTYMEWEVIGLKTMFYIYGEHMDIGNDDEDILIIPLDRSITKKYDMMEREKIYALSLHYVFNSRVLTAVKWYQSSWFSALVNAVGVVLMIYSVGSSEFLLGLIQAVGTGSITTVVNLLIMGFVESQILQAGLKIFVEAVGIDAAIVLSLVASAVGFGLGGASAQSLMGLSSSLIKASQNVMKDLGNALQEESDLFGIQSSIQEMNLRSSQQLLEDTPHTLHPFMLVGETPSSFYNRTVGNLNPGVLVYDMLSNFHANAVKLPTIDQTFGEIENGY